MQGIGEKREAIRSAAKHLAQNAGHYLGLERILGETDRRELDRYFAFQHSYAKERSGGKPHEEAFRLACEATRY